MARVEILSVLATSTCTARLGDEGVRKILFCTSTPMQLRRRASVFCVCAARALLSRRCTCVAAMLLGRPRLSWWRVPALC